MITDDRRIAFGSILLITVMISLLASSSQSIAQDPGRGPVNPFRKAAPSSPSIKQGDPFNHDKIFQAPPAEHQIKSHTPVREDVISGTDGQETSTPLPSSALQPGSVPSASPSISTTSSDDVVPVRLWLKWHSDLPKKWTGQIQILDGEITSIQRLGHHPDEAACIGLENNTIHVLSGLPRSADGVCINIAAKRQGTALLNLVADVAGESEEQIVMLRPDSNLPEKIEVGDGAHVTIRRDMPQMKVRYDHPHLIFLPKQSFTVHIEPIIPPREANRVYQCECYLEQRGKEINLSREIHVGMTDRFGAFSPIRPFNIELPEREGAYEIVFETKANLDGQPSSEAQLIDTRRLEVIVLQKDRPSTEVRRSLDADATKNPEENLWSLLKEIPLTDISRVEVAHGVDQFQFLLDGDEGIEKSVSSSKPTSEIVLRRLELNGLPAEQPLLLEVLLPAETAARYRFIVRCPETGSEVFDSTIEVPGFDSAERRVNLPHRLPFWSDTGHLILQIEQIATVNDEARPAIVRLLTSRESLPSYLRSRQEEGRTIAPFVRLEDLIQRVAADTQRQDGRQFIRTWDESRRLGDRLVQLMGYQSLDTAIVEVLNAGSTIYPSDIVSVTRGIEGPSCSAETSNLTQKDVLELWFRLFDREGLTLIPALHFNGAVQRVENLLARYQGPSQHIEVVNDQARLHYEFGDEEIHTVVKRAIEEVTEKYQHHKSFGGIAVVFDSTSFFAQPSNTEASELELQGHFTREGVKLEENVGREHKTLRENLPCRDALKDLLTPLADSLFADASTQRLFVLEQLGDMSQSIDLIEQDSTRGEKLSWLSNSRVTIGELPYDLIGQGRAVDQAALTKLQMDWQKSRLAGNFSQRSSCSVLGQTDTSMIVETDRLFNDGQSDYARRFRNTFRNLSNRPHTEIMGDESASDPAVHVRVDSKTMSGYCLNATSWPTIVELRFQLDEATSPLTVTLDAFETKHFSSPQPGALLTTWTSARRKEDRENVLAWCEKLEHRLGFAETLTLYSSSSIRNPGLNLVDRQGTPEAWQLFLGQGIEIGLGQSVAGTEGLALRIATHTPRFWEKPPVGSVQSAPFLMPKSGRLALKARIALEPGSKPEQLNFGLVAQETGKKIPLTFRYTSTGVPDANSAMWYDFFMESTNTGEYVGFPVALQIELHRGGCIHLDHVETYDAFLTRGETEQLRRLHAVAVSCVHQGNFSQVESIERNPLTRVLMTGMSLLPDANNRARPTQAFAERIPNSTFAPPTQNLVNVPLTANASNAANSIPQSKTDPAFLLPPQSNQQPESKLHTFLPASQQVPLTPAQDIPLFGDIGFTPIQSQTIGTLTVPPTTTGSNAKPVAKGVAEVTVTPEKLPTESSEAKKPKRSIKTPGLFDAYRGKKTQDEK